MKVQASCKGGESKLQTVYITSMTQLHSFQSGIYCHLVPHLTKPIIDLLKASSQASEPKCVVFRIGSYSITTLLVRPASKPSSS